jgi:iron complex outermembrane receptor protein
LDVSYEFNEDNLVYATVARGARPGGGNASYPTTGAFWGPAYAPFNYTNGWPKSYKSDAVWSYELGGKERFLDRRLTVDASIYYEDWQTPQLLAYPGDWAFNVNGDKAKIEGSDVDVKAKLGAGFTLGTGVGYTHADVSPGAHWEISPRNVMPDVPKFNGNVSLSLPQAPGQWPSSHGRGGRCLRRCTVLAEFCLPPINPRGRM